MVTEVHHGVAARDVIHLLRGGDRLLGGDALREKLAQSHGGGDGLGGVAAVCVAREGQVHRVQVALAVDQAVVRDAPIGGWPAEFPAIGELLCGVPVHHAVFASAVDDRAFGARAAGGIAGPAEAGADPLDIRGIPSGGGYGNIVAVRDDLHVGASLYARAEGALDLVDLAHAVQLVAREVQQYQHVRVEFLGDFGDVQLIDFQHDCVSVAAGKQRADHARVHVVAALVSADGRGCADGADQHAGGCGLAVCACDQHRWTLLAILAGAEACH